MNERRRFLHVLTGAVAAIGSTHCGTDPGPDGAGGEGGTNGQGGDGGNGGSASSSSASSSSGNVCMPIGTNVGVSGDFATDGLYKIAGTSVLIGRDAGGLYAMSALCTHQQCNLNGKGVLIAGGIHCNCHGAEYDLNGTVTKGPAVNSLKHYQLAVECDGSLWVNPSMVVPSDQRLMV